MTIREREDAMFKELRELAPDVVPDGLANEAEFRAAPLRIVYVLKEVNGAVPDLRDFLKNGGRPQTWDTVARWTEAILKCDIEHEWSYWASAGDKRREKYLPKIGVVNLKKTPGGHTSVSAQVRIGAERFHEIIRAQLELYRPHLVICGGTSSDLCKYCFPNESFEWKQTVRGIWYADTGKFILISYVHPEARVSDNILHYPLVEAVHEIIGKRGH